MLRTDVRLNRARLYVANAEPIKLERQAKATLEIPPATTAIWFQRWKAVQTVLLKGSAKKNHWS